MTRVPTSSPRVPTITSAIEIIGVNYLTTSIISGRSHFYNKLDIIVRMLVAIFSNYQLKRMIIFEINQQASMRCVDDLSVLSLPGVAINTKVCSHQAQY